MSRKKTWISHRKKVSDNPVFVRTNSAADKLAIQEADVGILVITDPKNLLKREKIYKCLGCVHLKYLAWPRSSLASAQVNVLRGK